MCHFHYPSPRFPSAALPLALLLGIGFVWHMQDVACRGYQLLGRFAVIAFVQAQILLLLAGIGPLDHHCLQGCTKQLHVGALSTADDYADWHAATIDDQAALRAPLGAVSWIRPRRLTSQRRFRHCPVYGLPIPDNPLHFIIFGQSLPPQALEDASPTPALKVAVQSLAGAELFGHRIPLTTSAQHIKNACHQLARISRRAAPDIAALMATTAKARLWFRQQRFDSLPETIR